MLVTYKFSSLYLAKAVGYCTKRYRNITFTCLCYKNESSWNAKLYTVFQRSQKLCGALHSLLLQDCSYLGLFVNV